MSGPVPRRTETAGAWKAMVAVELRQGLPNSINNTGDVGRSEGAMQLRQARRPESLVEGVFTCS